MERPVAKRREMTATARDSTGDSRAGEAQPALPVTMSGAGRAGSEAIALAAFPAKDRTALR